MARWQLRLLLPVLLLGPPRAAALLVSFEMQNMQQLVTLQDFGTTGGEVNVSIHIAPAMCTNASASTCWSALDHAYLAIFTYDQWSSLTFSILKKDVYGDRADLACTQPAVAWTSLSLLAWQEAAAAPDGAADLGLGGSSAFIPAAEDVTVGRPLRTPAPLEPLHFRVRYALPSRPDLYTLVLFNCLAQEELVLSGDASFVGGNGETLSTRQQDVLYVRFGLIALCLLCAAALLALCMRYRSTCVPLHGLLVLVLVLRAVQQALLVLPAIVASRGVSIPAGSLITAAALDSYSASTTTDAASRSAAQMDAPSQESPPADLDPQSLNAPPSPPLAQAPAAAATLVSPAAAINATEWDLQRASLLGASAAKELASLAFITALLAVAAGRHFLFPTTPAREREALTAAYVLFFGFGMLQEACTGEVRAFYTPVPPLLDGGMLQDACSSSLSSWHLSLHLP